MSCVVKAATEGTRGKILFFCQDLAALRQVHTWSVFSIHPADDNRSIQKYKAS